MGKSLRSGEEAPLTACLEQHGVPVLARIDSPGSVEGGDTMWLDHDTLAVGLGFRTNPEAVRQMRAALEPLGVTVLDYDLPYFTGPEACLHLLSLISPVTEDTAVAYPQLMPTAFWKELQERGIKLLEVPYEEFLHTQATNVLAVEPGRVIMLDGNPVTQKHAARRRLRGTHLPRRRPLVQDRGRAHVPHPPSAARLDVRRA